MNMFNIVHGGPGSESDIALALIGLGRGDVGRFRSAWIERTEENEPRVAVYTRNGAGNRECWCLEPLSSTSARRASEKCPEGEQHVVTRRVVKTEEQGGLVIERPTNETEEVTVVACGSPDSPECHCVGCTAEYQLPANPWYIADADDEFDGTYATFYFRVPDECHDVALALSQPEVDMSKRWDDALEAIANGDMSEEQRRFADDLTKKLSDALNPQGGGDA